MCGMFHLREEAFYQLSQMSLLARANSNQLKKDSSYLILIYMWKIFMQLESVQFIVKIKRCETRPYPALCLSYDSTKIHVCLIYFEYFGSFTPNCYICRGMKIPLQFPGIEECPLMQRYNCWTVCIFALRTVTAAV